MDDMETETSQIQEQLVSLDQRLMVVERDLAVLIKTAATKEDLMNLHRLLGADIARIDATVAAIQQNGATKADLSALETRIMKWMIATLVGVGALNSTLVLIVVKLMQL